MSTQFPESDVQLVARALGADYWTDDERAEAARAILAALAEAGRLAPDGATREVEYAIKWVREDNGNIWYSEPYYRRDVAESHRTGPETVVQRTIHAGPWVEADEDGTPNQEGKP